MSRPSHPWTAPSGCRYIHNGGASQPRTRPRLSAGLLTRVAPLHGGQTLQHADRCVTVYTSPRIHAVDRYATQVRRVNSFVSFSDDRREQHHGFCDGFSTAKYILESIHNYNLNYIVDRISMFRRKGRGERQFDNVDYTQLTETDNGFVDAQFLGPPVKIPWKAITLAVLLFVAGSVMLIVGSLIISGHIDTKYADRMWPVIILGGLMFIPGLYHIRVAIFAYRKVPGYSFDDIPEFD